MFVLNPLKSILMFSSAKPLASFILACLFGVTLLATEARGARGRPQVDQSLGFNVIISDKQTLLRGVSISFDGGDPYGSLPAVMPTQLQLDALAKTYGLNTLHLYLEGDSAGPNGNNDPVGYNAAACDLLVQRCADAGLYLIITIGCNGKNGQMNLEWSQRFWNFYGPRYKNQTHVIYEAHNEPAPNSLWQWTTNDWNNQIALYKTIRAVAPDTLILLCSFMGFAGDNNLNSVYDPRNRANYLAANGVDWSNAAIAHHGYESKIGVETAISLLQSGTSYPALLCTEFWPGDTTGQEYNNMYESHHNGWMQFQWLGANDNDLSGADGFKQKINTAGTVWTPDAPTCNWPARGTPFNIPAHNSTVGIYARGEARFVRVNAAGDLVADLPGYTGSQGDRFTVERSGMNLISLKASNGLYVSSSSQTDSLSAVSPTVGAREKFQWIELASGAVVLRAYGGGGHLLRPANGVILPDADNGLATSTHYTLVNGSAPSGPPPLPTNLPSPWQTADIGAVGAPGTVDYTNGVFTMAGSGADIEGTADAFRYVYQAANGDVTIVARVATQQNTDYWAKTGVMIRESATAGSANAAVLVSAEGGVVFQRRSSANGSTAVSRVEGLRAPRWVKLVRTGNSFSAYHSADGAVWTQIETSQTINMAASATVGLAVCSHKVNTLGESTLDNVAVSGTSVGVAAPAFNPAPGSYASAQSVAISSATPGASIRYTLDGTTPSSTAGTPYSGPVNITAGTTLKALAYASGATDSAVTSGVYTLSLLPSPWQAADIGAVGPSGTTFYGSGVFTVAGSGADIESTADAFRYVYQAANGDVTIVARVATQQNTDYWAKTGVMIRESATAGSANAAVLVSAEGGVVFQRRSSANGSTAVSRVEGLRAPRWVKLVRTGNSFSAYHSADGAVWTQIETSQTINMAASATVGLAVCSHKVDTLAESTLDNVAVSGGSGDVTPPTNPTPVISASGTLAAVNTIFPNASPSPTSFNVAGTNLTAGITVTAPTRFEVSTAVNGTYASTVTIAGSGTISSTPIFVRLAANTPVGTYSGNLVLSSSGATSVNVATVSSSVTTWTYSFGDNGNVNSFNYNGSTMPNLGVSALTKNGVTATVSSTNNFRASDWSTSTLLSNKYFEFTITASQGFTITNPSITFGVGRNGSGPRRFEWRSSVDSYATAIPVTANNILVSNNNNVLQVIDSSQNYTGNTVSLTTSGQSQITFRFYAYGAEGTGGTGGLAGNLTFSGTLVENPASPMITANGTLDAVTTTYGTASTTPTSFTVSGADMTEGIKVTPPAGFEVSTSSTFASGVGNSASPITIGSSGTIAQTTVYVRLAASAPVASSPFSGNIVLSSAGAPSVNVATVSSTVNKATPTITAPTASAITFGQTLADSAVSGGTASVPGTFAFTTPATAPNAGTASQGVTFTPTDAANYNTATSSVNVTVNKAEVDITEVPTASVITFGQTLADSTLSGGAASVPGTFAFTNPATAPNAGTASQGVTFTPTDAANYNTATSSVNVTVNKATPTIATAPTASAITFGQTLADSTLSSGTASVPGTFAFTNPATAPNAGTASQGVTFTPTDAANYNSATTTVNVTVNKAVATITLGDLVATFDGEAKAASASTVPQGLNVMLTYDGSAVAPSAVGSYAVVGTIDDANYQGSASGTLVIEKISRPTLADLLADLYSLSGVDAEALADPDSDGVPNLIEYAFGSSPVLPASLPEAARLVIGENATSFSAIVRDDSNLTAIPQFSVDLVTWGVAGITELDTAEVSQDGVPSGFTRRTWKIEGSMPQMYLRWRVKYGD